MKQHYKIGVAPLLLIGMLLLSGLTTATEGNYELKLFVKEKVLIDIPTVGDNVTIHLKFKNPEDRKTEFVLSLIYSDRETKLTKKELEANESYELSGHYTFASMGEYRLILYKTSTSGNTTLYTKELNIRPVPEVSPLIYLIIIGCAGGLLFAAFLAVNVLRKNTGTRRMKQISDYIKEGAEAFLSTQYRTIFIIAIIVAVLFAISIGLGVRDYYGVPGWQLGVLTAVAFISGACCSALSGYIGMFVSIRSNVRTASASHRSLDKSLKLALWGGAVSGFAVVALSLLGVAGIYTLYGELGGEPRLTPLLIVGFGFGASLVALFAQLGGGIYTKAADVGADLVGKVERGIPEDDPRNAAVIADLVGDNVGDCAGRGADLFESTAAENIGAMILGIALYPVFGINGIMFPLVARAFGLLATIIGILVVKTKENENPMSALNRGYYMTCFLGFLFFGIAAHYMLGAGWYWFWAAGTIGIMTSIAFVFITQYYTEARYRPVKEIAKSSKTGAATNIITGFSVGFECTGISIIVISVALLGAFYIGIKGAETLGFENTIQGGLYGTAIATMGMLATCAYILALDTFGPITDNASGINEMSGDAPKSAQRITARLDAVGNTTKAITKGYAVGSAALAAFLLFSAYMTDAHLSTIDLAKPVVFVGAMVGAMLVFVFSAFAIRAVGRAAYHIINEVRRQFREIPGIMKGTHKPDYARCVAITTRGALKEMVLPGLVAVITPVAVGLLLRAEALGATLMVGTIVGVILALVLNNSGGAWDNAKKFIEDGNYGGKGSEPHKAGVVGDTVGDPFKDTAGPSLHILVKLLSTITLVLAPLFI